jgi:hypothetical protein
MVTTMSLALFAGAAVASDGSARQSVRTKGDVKLTVSVDKAVAQVADPIGLRLQVTAPKGIRVELPRLPKELGDFEAHSKELVRDVPSSSSPDERLWELRATLETLETGRVVVPSFDVHFTTDAARAEFQAIRSEPIEIEITSVLENRADPTNIRDIKGVVDVEVPQASTHPWGIWAAAGIGVAAVAVWAAVWLASRRRGPMPTEWALAEMEDLEKLHTEDAVEAALVCNELVDIVREYFEYEFGVPAISRTSREFLHDVAETIRLPGAPRQRLEWLLSLADEIKFASHGVGNRQVREAFEGAKALVVECEQHRLALERKVA